MGTRGCPAGRLAAAGRRGGGQVKRRAPAKNRHRAGGVPAAGRARTAGGAARKAPTTGDLKSDSLY